MIIRNKHAVVMSAVSEELVRKVSNILTNAGKSQSEIDNAEVQVNLE